VSVASYGYVPSSPILVTVMMGVLSSSETSVLTRATRRNISEYAILYVLPIFYKRINESAWLMNLKNDQENPCFKQPIAIILNPLQYQ
jgi:hypothetical protein